MPKSITRIVLTGGPAAGKTTLISRILKEFKQEDGWRVITIPETATDLISGFGIKPFGNCVSMLDFQYFVIEDQLHKEKLALKAARMVPEEKVLVIYDRALLDDKAYITDDEFTDILTSSIRAQRSARFLLRVWRPIPMSAATRRSAIMLSSMQTPRCSAAQRRSVTMSSSAVTHF